MQHNPFNPKQFSFNFFAVILPTLYVNKCLYFFYYQKNLYFIFCKKILIF